MNENESNDFYFKVQKEVTEWTKKYIKSLPNITPEESKELLEIASKPLPKSHGNHDNKERNYAIITLFLNCGMRLSELVGINIKDIDFYEEKLNVIG